MYITLDHVEPLTRDVTTFWFKPEQPLRFIPGQYIEIHLPHPAMDNRGDRRWMTIASIPGQPLIAITMKFARAPDYSSTYKSAFRRLQPGTTLYASDAIGDFVLPKSPFTPIVFMALGIGITPVQSMMLSLAQTGESRQIDIIHGGRTEDDLIFRHELQAMTEAYTPLVIQPPNNWTGQSGYLNGQRLLDMTHRPAASPSDTLYYMSGPEAPVLRIIDELYALGIQRHQIAMDYFPGYLVP